MNAKDEYRKWMIAKLKEHYRFDLVTMFTFGEIVWEAATENNKKLLTDLKEYFISKYKKGNKVLLKNFVARIDEII